MKYNCSDIIAALATTPGNSALSVIRISGESLKNLFFQITNINNPLSNYVYLVKLLNPNNTKHVLDQVMITYFKNPKSYTGEDCIEISCHGGKVIANTILKALYMTNIREASPGEFSYRSFLNGKIDLIQAEAIYSIVSSQAEIGVQFGLDGVVGKNTNTLKTIQTSLKSILMDVENELDFSEEDSNNFKTNLLSNISNLKIKLNRLIDSTVVYNKLKAGIRIVLVGRPNSGKSSLFNYLIGENRAIVSDVAGTTRDTIESWHEISGVSVCFVDTAGIWESDDFLEKLGIKKTYDEILKADLLLVLDERNPSEVFSTIENKISHDNVVFLKTKSDLDEDSSNLQNTISISVKNDDNANYVLNLIKTIVKVKLSKLPENYFFTTQRQQLILNSVFSDFESLAENFNLFELDVVASKLWGIVDKYDSLFGTADPESIINDIFSNFCVGK